MSRDDAIDQLDQAQRDLSEAQLRALKAEAEVERLQSQLEAEVERRSAIEVELRDEVERLRANEKMLVETAKNRKAEVERLRAYKEQYPIFKKYEEAKAEVERLRAENEGLKEDLKYRNDQYEGLAIRFDRIEEAAREVVAKGTFGLPAGSRYIEALRAALEEKP